MPPAFLPAAQVVPWVGLGVGLQGLYLLTSIGLNITKRTQYYPIATAIAAATSVGANLVLVPTFGIIGAAWANAIAYRRAGAGLVAFLNRFYPIAYETARLVRIVTAAAISLIASRLLVPSLRPLPGLLAHGTVVVIVFGAVLVVSRFFVRHEIEEVLRLVSRVRRRKVVELPSDATELAGEIVTTPTTDLAVEVEPVGQSLSGRRRRRGDIVARGPTHGSRVRHVRIAVCDVQEFNVRAVPAQVPPILGLSVGFTPVLHGAQAQRAAGSKPAEAQRAPSVAVEEAVDLTNGWARLAEGKPEQALIQAMRVLQRNRAASRGSCWRSRPTSPITGLQPVSRSTSTGWRDVR